MQSRWLDGFLARIPSQCAICNAWPAQRTCADCTARFALQRPRCRTCAIVVPEGVAQCGACLSKPPALRACIAAVDYGYPWAEVLAAFKFGADPGWARALAHLMRQAPRATALLEDADWLCPIPLSTQRLRERGFNQAALLAHALAPRKTQDDWLLRPHATPLQSQSTRAQRLKNLRHAFAVCPSHRLGGAHVLLIDDVMTTGSTLEAAARTLIKAGAAHVSALVVARTPLPGQ